MMGSVEEKCPAKARGKKQSLVSRMPPQNSNGALLMVLIKIEANQTSRMRISSQEIDLQLNRSRNGLNCKNSHALNSEDTKQLMSI
jgi:hypothetical protein